MITPTSASTNSPVNSLPFALRPNDLTPRINIMGASGVGKTGVLTQAHPGLLWLTPNPEAVTATSRKVAGYVPTVLRVPMTDPFGAFDTFSSQSWNILQKTTNEKGETVMVPYLTDDPESVVDGEHIQYVDDVPFPWWGVDRDGHYYPNYSGVAVDDIDLAFKASINLKLAEAGIKPEELLGADGKSKRATIYQMFRADYEPALTLFDNLSSECRIAVFSTTKVTTNNTDFRGNTVKYTVDFGSAAFVDRGSFMSHLDANFHLKREVNTSSLIDLPGGAIGLQAGLFGAQLNTDPNDLTTNIKNRFKYQDKNAPANLREVLAVAGTAYRCPLLAGFDWYLPCSEAVAVEFEKACAAGKVKEIKARDEVVTALWAAQAAKYGRSWSDFKGDYRSVAGSDLDADLIAVHVARLAWAIRDGLHRGYLRHKMNEARFTALGF